MTRKNKCSSLYLFGMWTVLLSHFFLIRMPNSLLVPFLLHLPPILTLKTINGCGIVLWFLFCCCDKASWPKVIYGNRHLFWLTVAEGGESVMAGKHDKWKAWQHHKLKRREQTGSRVELWILRSHSPWHTTPPRLHHLLNSATNLKQVFKCLSLWGTCHLNCHWWLRIIINLTRSRITEETKFCISKIDYLN